MKYKLPFPNAPITEALLDIRVEKTTNIELSSLLTFYEQIKDKFPNKQNHCSWKGGVQLKDGKPEIEAPSGGVDGYLFRTVDGKKVVQARTNGFTFNKLKPYANWDVFSEEAKELWKHYYKIVQPNNIIRLALRYINKIEIPLPMGDFKEYILTIPEIAEGLPQGLSTYFMRLQIPKPEILARAIITQTFKPVKADATTLPLIFDIDVVKEVRIKSDSSEIWNVFDELRIFKNDVFLKSTTDKAKELFL